MSRVHSTLVIGAALLGLAAAGSDLRAAAGAARLASAIDAEGGYISAPDLAGRIVRGDGALHIVDLGSGDTFERLHVASARHASLDDLGSLDFPPDATVVLYADGGTDAERGWMLLRTAGHRRVAVLREGLYEWIVRVLEPRLARDATAAERAEFARDAELSRFFGGVPLAGVARAEVAAGYWTGQPRSQQQRAGMARRAVATIRRRGC